MAFNIDYRPKTFDQMMGNSETVASLKEVLEQKSRPHVYLFSGPSGCGKTTLGRIVASEIGCHEHDLIEINSSNNRGIDTARDIISQMYYKPLHGPVKVYILDEVHQTTKDFQNALLKALEDTPLHVYFILCTTEPEKLIPTIRNRATAFSVEKLGEKKLVRLLQGICAAEKTEIDREILSAIAERSEGSPRQAVIMLQQIISLSDSDAMKKVIISFKTEERTIIELCKALLEGKSWKVVSQIIKGIEDEPEKVRRAVLGYCSAVLLNSGNERAALIIECFSDNYFNTGKAGLIFSCFQVVN